MELYAMLIFCGFVAACDWKRVCVAVVWDCYRESRPKAALFFRWHGLVWGFCTLVCAK